MATRDNHSLYLATSKDMFSQIKWEFVRTALKCVLNDCFLSIDSQKKRCDSSPADRAFLFDEETKIPYVRYRHTFPNNTSLYLGVSRNCTDDRLSLKCRNGTNRLCQFKKRWSWIINQSIGRSIIKSMNQNK